MPRRPNTKPTNIYWLFDMRPETLLTYPNGQPFYCGKTQSKIEYRLTAHKGDAPNHPERPTYAMLLRCGEHIRAALIEVVPLGENWSAREKLWIANLRVLNPNCTNLSDGGGGSPGNIMSDAQKDLLRQKMLGRTFKPETLAKMSKRMLGNPIRKGKKLSAEGRTRQSERQTGRTTRPKTDDEKRRISESNRGQKRSETTKAALRAAWVRRKARSGKNNVDSHDSVA